jgi:dinuclear metal center YbgI/SA1388 family protein
MTTVRELYNYLDEIAPFNCQDKTDNAGLLVGNFNAEVKKILVCLDVTNNVVAEAVLKEADLIIAHHPLMYHPVTKIVGNDPLRSLTRSNVNLIAVHTNLDIAIGGIADLMLAKLDFPKSETVILPINPDGSGYGRITELDTPVFAKDLAEKCKAAFNCTVVRYVDSGKALSKIGVSSGSAEESVEAAFDAGCDAFICGEVAHDRMLFAADYGLTLIEAGHFHTEDIFCENLIVRLKSKFKGIEIEKSKNSVDVCHYTK